MLTERKTTSTGAVARAIRTARYSLFWGALRRQKGWLAGGFVFLVLAAAMTLRATQIVTAIVDQAINERSAALGPLIGELVAIYVLGFVVSLVAKLISERIGYQLEFDLRNLLYLRLQRSDPHDLDRFATGQVVTRALTDLTLLEYFIRIVSAVVALVPVFLGFTIFLLVSNPILTIVTCSGYVINGLLVNKIRHRLWGLSFVGLDQTAKVTAAIDEPVRGIRVVKAFAREEDERRRIKDLAQRAYEFTLTRVRLEARYDLLLRAAPVLIRGLLVLLGARFVVNGSLSLGEFLIFFSFTQIGITIATYMDEAVSAYQYVKTGAGRITELLRSGARGARELFEPVPPSTTGLELDRVTVAFGDVAPVADLTLRVEPGSLVFLTGGPGSGKSTVAGIAAGSLAPTSGTAHLDGTDLSRIDPLELARHVHLVAEEPFLFARTLRDNLAIGVTAAVGSVPAVTDDELMAALHAAGADDVVADLEGGLAAHLGDRGLTLSGGQRQRLSLARALVRPPRLLILDDALSAVSPALEVDILRRIRQHAPSTAILCIGQRSGPQVLADDVLELEREVPLTDARAGTGISGELAAPAAGDRAAAGTAPMLDGVPYDARLVEIIAKLRFAGDKPTVTDADAERDERPSFAGVLRPVAGLAIGAFVLTVILQALNLVPEYLFGEVSDYVERGDTRTTDRLSLIFMAVALAIGGFTYVFRITKGKATNGILYLLRRRIFGRLSRLGIDYYDRELPGQVATRVVHDLNQIERFLGKGSASEGVYEMGGHVTKFLLALAVMVYLSPDVGFIVVGFAAVVLLLTIVQLPLADRALARARDALGDVIARLQEDFAGRYVINAFGAQRQARQDYGAAARRLRRAGRRAENIGATYGETLDFVGKLATAAVFWRAGNLALSGAITVGTVLSLRLFLSEALRPVPQITKIFYDTLRARVSFRQLATMWDAPILPTVRPEAPPCPELEGELAFEGVTFSYPGTNRRVLHDLSFRAAPGERIAIVGFTGAGKSSIAKLVSRMYDPDTGRILVDGHDVRDLELTSYRRRIGVVPQEAFLFTGTIAANIAYSRPDASPSQIEAAARAVGAYNVLVALEGGLDAKVEEEGRNLTAAERQLVAIARAVLAAPDILVLDEATASLDAATESRVIDAVLALGLTTILVTHRLAVAERADLAIMIERGAIIDAGEHRELMASGRGYATLWSPASAPRRRRRRRASEVGGGPEPPKQVPRIRLSKKVVSSPAEDVYSGGQQ